MDINPIIKMDCPDPDVIRVGDTYYMVATTMYFMPGCQILRSYDLINWESAAYVYETLDGTPGQKMDSDLNIYGRGMWAATIRHHEGKFYICFVANDTHKTYLFVSENIEGPWEKRYVEGFYHDCSILFDDDGRVYIVYGNRDIWLTELKSDLSGPLSGGVHRKIINDTDNKILGYEGAHFYKINGKYYIFFINSRSDRWMRKESCFVADSIDGEFRGKDVLEDDRNYCGQGVAQGGIVDTPDGKWYAVLFQDSGAVGRIPILVPISWENDFPVFGDNGKIPMEIQTQSTRPDYKYKPLVGSDDFKSGSLDSKWQFNHEPDNSAYQINPGYYEITTNKLSSNLTQAKNTLTQRMMFPSCSGEVEVDASGIKEGDYAGICALQGCYGMVGVTRRDGKLFVVMKNKESDDLSLKAMEADIGGGREWEAVETDQSILTLKISVDFMNMVDESFYYYKVGNDFKQIGTKHKLCFKLDHFTGCRFGLFMYSTKETGGKARFMNFIYSY